MFVFDLFCGSGGASVGLTHAGCKVIGVDLRSPMQTDYPTGYLNMFGRICDFVRDDPTAVLRELLDGRAVANRSLSAIDFFWLNLPAYLCPKQDKSRLAELLRRMLDDTKKPYVIAYSSSRPHCIGRHSFTITGPEIGQVPKEREEAPCVFKGRSFRPGLIYTKLFETNRNIHAPKRIGSLPGIYGRGRESKKHKEGMEGWDYLSLDHPEKNTGQIKKQAVLKAVLGITWTRGRKDEQKKKIINSCPPAYSRYIGAEMRSFLDLEKNKKQKPLEALSLPRMGEAEL